MVGGCGGLGGFGRIFGGLWLVVVVVWEGLGRFVVVCDVQWWFVMVVVVCDGFGGFWWFVMVCGGLWWFVVVCDGFWWL